MKLSPTLMMLPIALGVGYFIGKPDEDPSA
jgi:hypothetical protein